ncbi:MAG: DnaD domain protein [Lachnospiraceae bacterium]|jgi:DnaD/phage-associated family protein
MNPLSIHNYLTPEVTIIPNHFLDHYMPRANGEFIKVYLYLLRITGRTNIALSLASIADQLNCTEKDVLRALKYWEQESLLSLTFDDSQELTDICFLPFTEETATAYTAAAAPAPPEKAALENKPSPVHASTRMSLGKLQKLQQNEEVRQLLFIASQYMGKTLTPIETEKILFFYEELHLSADLIEYLIESCVSKNHTSIHYMEKIALSWAEKGISTVSMAKQNNSTYHRDYYAILKALGITGREPVEAEITFMNTWMNEYSFTLDVITEACQAAAMQTFRPGMKYANAILKDWHERGVKHLSDVKALKSKETDSPRKDAQKKENAFSEASAKQLSDKKSYKYSKNNNRFNNFPQRSQDFSQLEKQLLNK